MQLDEAVDGLVGVGGFAVLPVAIRDVDLRLLREMAERVAAFEAFEVLRALAEVAAGKRVLSLRI